MSDVVNGVSANVTPASGTINNVLGYDATGAPVYQSSTALSVSNIYTANGTLTGARTVTQGANTLAFTSTATNGFSVDGTTFSVDAANDRVGIGTTTPTNSFTVTNAGTTVTTATTYPLAIQRIGSTDITLGSDASYAYMQSWNSKPLSINTMGNNLLIGSNNTLNNITKLNIANGGWSSMNASFGQTFLNIPAFMSDVSDASLYTSTTVNGTLNGQSVGSEHRLYIEDDGNDDFSIYGNSCGGGACFNLNNSAYVARFFGSGTVQFRTLGGSGGTRLVQADNNGVLSYSPYDPATGYILNQTATDQTAGFRINGKANVNNGSPFAVPNNYMAAGSLTIGGTTANYGGGAGWNASTSGILMEALDNTEIAVHDAGTRIASLMYFEGAGTNRINIGRDMGWGTIGTISMNGNVGIGTNAPARRLEVNNAMKFTNSSSDANDGVLGTATFAAGLNIVGINTDGTGRKVNEWGSIIQNENAVGNTFLNNSYFNGRVGVGTTTSTIYQLNTYATQLTAGGDGQSTIFSFRTRDSQNDGIGYGIYSTNNAITGFNYWGDVYTFGIHGASFGDYTRTGGVLGSVSGTSAWGILGYKTSASTFFGVYGSASYGSGAGYLPTTNLLGIGGGFYGGIAGSWSKGSIIGQISAGELAAAYNAGNVYTSGHNVEIITTADTRVAAYSNTSTEATISKAGRAQLVAGKATVSFDEVFSSLIATDEEPIISITPYGNCNGIHIVEVTKNGFVVEENNSGVSDVKFTYMVMAKRIDANTATLPVDLKDKNFDKNLNEALFDENNKEQSARPIWWDGTKIRFDKAPEIKMDKKEIPNNPSK